MPALGLFFGTIITCKTCLESTAPILFELACEQAYPIGEGMTTMLLTYTNNVLALGFLTISSIPGIGRVTVVMVALVAVAMAVVLMEVTVIRSCNDNAV